MKKTIFILLIILLFTCSKCEKEELSIARIDYSGTDIRLDGFYYNEPDKAHFFLYRNGVMYYGGAGFNGQFDDLKKFYTVFENYKSSYQIPYSWGIYVVNSPNIIFEKWVSSDAFGRYTTTQFSGKIVNDTTLLINHPAEIIGRDTFYFHQFNSKPDSTNNYVK